MEKLKRKTNTGVSKAAQNPKITIPRDRIKAFCQRHSIVKLSLFGSVLRNDFNQSSDLDVLVEFAASKKIGLIGFSGIEIELGNILGQKVDLNTTGFLSKYYRDEVLAQAEVLYDAT